MNQQTKGTKGIFNIYMASKLLKNGLTILDVKPSRTARGRAIFFFEDTPEFQKALKELSYNKN